jgi:hypothetical protein
LLEQIGEVTTSCHQLMQRLASITQEILPSGQASTLSAAAPRRRGRPPGTTNGAQAQGPGRKRRRRRAQETPAEAKA